MNPFEHVVNAWYLAKLNLMLNIILHIFWGKIKVQSFKYGQVY